ncbi:MAG: hypothetical protein NTX13_05705, partial [Acidobacteria bacterium]|nr:hypothetical protein [Acidobacteriota bacterium]
LKLERRSLAKESQESRRHRHQRRRTRESKEERQPPIYQQLRDLREPQMKRDLYVPAVKRLAAFCSCIEEEQECS